MPEVGGLVEGCVGGGTSPQSSVGCTDGQDHLGMFGTTRRCVPPGRGCEETIEYQLKAASYAEIQPRMTDRRSKVQDLRDTLCAVEVQNTSNHH
jgi:hypothetical protein